MKTGTSALVITLPSLLELVVLSPSCRWADEIVFCDVSVVMLASASAEPMVSQLMIIMPQLTV
jgi:hypothetical protein